MNLNNTGLAVAVAAFAVALTMCGGAAPSQGPVNTVSPSASPELLTPPTSQAPASATVPPAPATKAVEPVKVPDSPKVAPPKPVEAPVTSVRIYVSNQCPKPFEYCVDDGSVLSTTLGSNTSTTHTVRPGAKFKVRSGSSCGNVVYTAPALKDEQKFTICKR